MSEKLKYFIEAWEMNGVGQTVATVQDSPGTVVSITVDDLRALLARQPAAIDKGEAVYVPVEPTEAMIRAACLNQSKAQFSSYEEWLDSHSSGVSERIRDLVSGDYRAMIAAARAASTSANVAQGAEADTRAAVDFYAANPSAALLDFQKRFNVAQGAEEPDCWAILTPNGSRLVSPDEAKGRLDAYPLYTAPTAQTALRRIAHELRTYNPAADEYKGEHIHKVWAREIEALLPAASNGESK